MSQGVTGSGPLGYENVRHPRDLAGVYGLGETYVAVVEAVTVWLARRGYSRHSVRGSRRSAGWACRYLARERGLASLDELSAEDVAAYAAHLSAYVSARTGRGLAASTIRARLRVLRTLDEYRVLSEGARPVVRALPEVEGAEPVGRRALSREEVAGLYAACDGLDEANGRGWGGEGTRARCVLGLLYGCGLRTGEARALATAEVDVVGGRLLVSRAKNGHQRYVPFAGRVQWDLEAWLGVAGGDGGARARYARARCDRVLVGRRGGPLGAQEVNRVLGVLCARAGVARTTAHGLRHAIATHLVGSGMAMEAVARFLGHRSLETTVRYAHVAVADVAAGEVTAGEGSGS